MKLCANSQGKLRLGIELLGGWKLKFLNQPTMMKAGQKLNPCRHLAAWHSRFICRSLADRCWAIPEKVHLRLLTQASIDLDISHPLPSPFSPRSTLEIEAFILPTPPIS